MFKKIAAIAVFMIISGWASASASLSTSSNFKSNQDEAHLVGEVGQIRLAHIRSKNSHRRSLLLDLDALATNSTVVKINVTPDRQIILNLIRREPLSGGRYAWIGRSVGGDDATLVVDGASVHGVVRGLNKTYEIKPLAGKLHVITDVDMVGFQPEHPDDRRSGAQMVLGVPRVKPASNAATDVFPASNGDVALTASGTVVSATAQTSAPVIDVLVAYTPKAKLFFGDVAAASDVIISSMNQSFANSGVSLQARVAGTFAVNEEYPDSTTALNALYSNSSVNSVRSNLKADVVVMIADFGDSCGLAKTIAAAPSAAYAVVASNCALSNLSMAHEIGHLIGARHNFDVDPSTSPFAYGHGWYHIIWYTNSNVASCFHTIMSYPVPSPLTDYARQGTPTPPANLTCSTDNRINYWSNITGTFNGSPLGRASDANNAAVLNARGGEVAIFGEHPGSSLTFLQILSTLMANMFVLDN